MQIGKTKLSCCSEADLIQGQNIFKLFLFLLFFWGFFRLVGWLVFLRVNKPQMTKHSSPVSEKEVRELVSVREALQVQQAELQCTLGQGLSEVPRNLEFGIYHK